MTRSGPKVQEEILIYVTNDLHGCLAADDVRKRVGLARLESLLKRARARGRVFLLDAGDIFSGHVFGSCDFGLSLAVILGQLDYDLLVPGNHDFDYTPETSDPFYYFKLIETMRASGSRNLKVSAVNVDYFDETVPGMENPPVLYCSESGGRIVVAGVANPYSLRPSLRQSLAGFDFGHRKTVDDIRTIIIGRLEEAIKRYNRPDDLVIVLTHLGHDGDGRVSGMEICRLPMVDFVVDGHSHQVVAPIAYSGSIYVNGGAWLNSLVEISLGPNKPATLKLWSYEELIQLEPDPEIGAQVSNLVSRLGLADNLLTLKDELTWPKIPVHFKSWPWGRLIGRAMMVKTGAEIAFVNSGAIRAGLVAGRVTRGDVLEALPYNDELVAGQVTGQKLMKLFDIFIGRGSFPQFYGLKAYVWFRKSGRPVLVGLLDLKGQVLDESKFYILAVNSQFVRTLGGLAMVDSDTYGNLATAVVDYLAIQPETCDLEESLVVFSDRQGAENAYKKDIESDGIDVWPEDVEK